jgi:hypothetical protein
VLFVLAAFVYVSVTGTLLLVAVVVSDEGSPEEAALLLDIVPEGA